jgi:hypothetical protein
VQLILFREKVTTSGSNHEASNKQNVVMTLNAKA